MFESSPLKISNHSQGRNKVISYFTVVIQITRNTFLLFNSNDAAKATTHSDSNYSKHDLIINSHAVLQELCEKPVGRMWVTIYMCNTNQISIPESYRTSQRHLTHKKIVHPSKSKLKVFNVIFRQVIIQRF